MSDHEHQPAQLDSTAENDGPTLLASFTTHYNPAGPAEALLVRRIVAATLRIDLLERSLDALMELGERRALIDHLYERFALNEPKMQVRDAPNYASMLRRYDGTAEIPPDFDPSLDPDPALCNLPYTLSGSRAALLMRHEATAERRLHTAMRELHRLQAERRKQEKECNEPTTTRSKTARDEPTNMQTADGGAMRNEATPRPAPHSRPELSVPPADLDATAAAPAATTRIEAICPLMPTTQGTITPTVPSISRIEPTSTASPIPLSAEIPVVQSPTPAAPRLGDLLDAALAAYDRRGHATPSYLDPVNLRRELPG